MLKGTSELFVKDSHGLCKAVSADLFIRFSSNYELVLVFNEVPLWRPHPEIESARNFAFLILDSDFKIVEISTKAPEFCGLNLQSLEIMQTSREYCMLDAVFSVQ